MSVTTIAFDAYGTLFDTGNGSVAATREILSRCEAMHDPAEVYSKWKACHEGLVAALENFESEEVIFRKGLEQVFREYGIEGDPCEAVRVMLATLGRRRRFDDASACIDWCRRRFQVVIASNTDTEPFLKDLSRSGLEVDRWFTSEALGFYKPHPHFYQRMLGALDLMPNQVIFVGDSLRADVQGPKACGMSAVWLNRKGLSLPDAECVVEVKGLAGLPRAILGLEGVEE